MMKKHYSKRIIEWLLNNPFFVNRRHHDLVLNGIKGLNITLLNIYYELFFKNVTRRYITTQEESSCQKIYGINYHWSQEVWSGSRKVCT